MIGETGKWAFAHDRVPGAPVAICPADHDGTIDLRVGWPVLGTVEPPAPIELVVCPAGRAIVHTYVGDFIGLSDEWRFSGSRYEGTGSVRAAPARALRDEPRGSERSVRARRRPRTSTW